MGNHGIIVCGPAGSGKTHNAAALAKHFGLSHIVDEWRVGDKVPADTLCLTQDHVPSSPTVWRIEDALQAMRQS